MITYRVDVAAVEEEEEGAVDGRVGGHGNATRSKEDGRVGDRGGRGSGGDFVTVSKGLKDLVAISVKHPAGEGRGARSENALKDSAAATMLLLPPTTATTDVRRPRPALDTATPHLQLRTLTTG